MNEGRRKGGKVGRVKGNWSIGNMILAAYVSRNTVLSTMVDTSRCWPLDQHKYLHSDKASCRLLKDSHAK